MPVATFALIKPLRVNFGMVQFFFSGRASYAPANWAPAAASRKTVRCGKAHRVSQNDVERRRLSVAQSDATQRDIQPSSRRLVTPLLLSRSPRRWQGPVAIGTPRATRSPKISAKG